MRLSLIGVFVAVAAVVAVLLSVEYLGGPVDPSASFAGAHVIVNGVVIQVELADEPEERRKGLMFRESMPRDHGMLFVFEGEGVHSFWMKNTMFSLDIVWIDGSGVVVHVANSLKPCLELCPSYGPGQPAMYVLEVNAGVADELGIKNGSSVEIVFTDE